ncbi:PrgI family mobile element protein [Nonomuraea sp. CA-218870]|uniref:PrgI family mobile element protein n=1 Tax=Nonomuraea sp. CA-218870 TaxID=3239998 RepID=UPI003D8DF429
MRHASKERLVAKIPADVEMPDKLFANLTVRQAAILAGTGVLAAWVYLMAGDRLPVPALVATLLPMIACGSALALGRRDGLSLDRLVLHAFAYLRRDRRLVTTEEGVLPPPAWCRVRGRLPGALRLPVRAIREDGVMELAEGGSVAVVRAGTVAFGLRTGEEQAALVGVFAGWLNSLDAPVQILLQARPVDLSDLADVIEGSAGRLADPALEQAARRHAEFLSELSATRDLLTRDVLVVVRHQDAEQPPGWMRRSRRSARRDSSAAIVMRRAEETVRSLLGLGVHASVVGAEDARDLLVRSLSPRRPDPVGVARPDEPITLGEGTR